MGQLGKMAWAAALLALCTVTLQARQKKRSTAALNDEGTFHITLAGSTIGDEKFEIRSSVGQIEARSQSDLQLPKDGKTLNFKTRPDLVLDSSFNPLSYRWSQTGAQSSRLEANFLTQPAQVVYRTVSGESDQREFSLSRDVAILDDNVIHQYELVVWRYDRGNGGAQTFPAFIPQEAVPGEITVQAAPDEPGQPPGTRHLVVVTDQARIDLWVDRQERLQKVTIASVGLEAVRDK